MEVQTKFMELIFLQDALYPGRANGSPSIYQQQSSNVSSTISHTLPVTMSSLMPLNGTSTPHSSVKPHSYYKSRRMSDTSGGKSLTNVQRI